MISSRGSTALGRWSRATATVNTDPGVYEPSDPFRAEFTNYPDQEAFLDQLRACQQADDLTYPVQKEYILGPDSQAKAWRGGSARPPEMEQQQVEGDADGAASIPAHADQDKVEGVADLPLANDYQGIGGPDSVPLFTPSAFQKPTVRPHQNCILDELFMAPTAGQLQAYERVLSRMQIRMIQARLKWALLVHAALAALLFIKLLPSVLDHLDLFVLELEELYLPKPLLWEWIWLLSFPASLLGLVACRKASASQMNRFVTLTFVLGLAPVLFGLVYHGLDVYYYVYSQDRHLEHVQFWRGYPVAVLWYVFFSICIQVHAFEMYFAGQLIHAWRCKSKNE